MARETISSGVRMVFSIESSDGTPTRVVVARHIDEALAIYRAWWPEAKVKTVTSCSDEGCLVGPPTTADIASGGD
jgi:hypothetical protein